MKQVMKSPRGHVRPWNPFEDMDVHFGKILNEWPTARTTNGNGWIPAIDVEETEDAYILTADLPGMKKEDISISVQDDVVTIRGERWREEKEDKENYHRVERQVGTFERSFTVHEGFDGEKVDAHYDNGVLKITLPKREERRPRQVDVRVQ